MMILQETISLPDWEAFLGRLLEGLLEASVRLFGEGKESLNGWRKGLIDVPTHTMVKPCNITTGGACYFL